MENKPKYKIILNILSDAENLLRTAKLANFEGEMNRDLDDDLSEVIYQLSKAKLGLIDDLQSELEKEYDNEN